MKKLFLALLLFPILALACQQQEEPLDKINFNLTARLWVSTKTALVSVNINAALTAENLVKAREDMMSQLQHIAKAQWHITQFDRSQDSSGLEKLHAAAEARVDQSLLSGLYQNAKAVSKPGTNYTIGNIEFKPSLEEIQAGRVALRQRLYQEINDELARINKSYQNQAYNLYRLVFSEGEQPQPVAAMERNMKTMYAAASAPAPVAVTVSNELSMTAMVIAASTMNTNKQSS